MAPEGHCWVFTGRGIRSDRPVERAPWEQEPVGETSHWLPWHLGGGGRVQTPWAGSVDNAGWPCELKMEMMKMLLHHA